MQLSAPAGNIKSIVLFFNFACYFINFVFFFQAEDGIRDTSVTGVQTCALPISRKIRNQTADPTSMQCRVGSRMFCRYKLLPKMKDFSCGHCGRTYCGFPAAGGEGRSEERRVGKEWRWGWGSEE